jgi:chromate transporter
VERSCPGGDLLNPPGDAHGDGFRLGLRKVRIAASTSGSSVRRQAGDYIAIVLQALWALGHAAIKNAFLLRLAVLATVAAILNIDILFVLLGCGFAATAREAVKEGNFCAGPLSTPAGIKPVLPVAAASAGVVPVTLLGLFLVFLKFGAVIFGSGYVQLAFLQADLVARLHWLTQAQLLDAVAVGQVKPGPVFKTAAFIRHLLGRAPGAVIAMLVLFCNWLVGFLR